MHIATLAIAALAVLPVQEQTPENAKAFMSAVISRGGVRMLVGSENLETNAEVPLSSSPASSSFCAFAVSFVVPANATASDAGSSRTQNIPFERVESITRSGAVVRLVGHARVRLTFRTEDTAIRFAYAAEVLRLRCDPTAAYGF